MAMKVLGLCLINIFVPSFYSLWIESAALQLLSAEVPAWRISVTCLKERECCDLKIPFHT